MPPVYCTTCVFYARLNTYSVRHRHHAYVRSTPLLFHRVFVHLLRYATFAVTLRTSDLDTGFFHTDMKVLAVHFHDQPTVLYCVPTNSDPRSFCARPVR